MLLLFDIGNTNIVIGIHDEKKLAQTWRIHTENKKTTDEYYVLLQAFLLDCQINKNDITDIVISSVVPELTTIFERLSTQKFMLTPLIVQAGIKTGINIRIDESRQVGADLIVTAAAIYHKHKKTAIIIDMGTATTFSVITKDGDFLGGAITPGIELASAALFQNAAKLPTFNIEAPPQVIGRSTQHAVQSGLVFGYTSLIDGMIDRIIDELQQSDIQIVATGGQAKLISHYSKYIKSVEENLIFDGLKIIYDLNKK